jgi:UDP-GlcNAc:undecaprenyl-phosphate GlcNAc-1-phosphate transferase
VLDPSVLAVFVVALVLAAALSLTLTPAVRSLAVLCGVLDRPDPRKIHVGAVPRWGGVAVGAAAALAVAGAFAASPWLRTALFSGGGAARWGALALGATLILAAGVVDDARGLSARFKLVLEIAAAALVVALAPLPHAVALGPGAPALELGPVAAALAVLWIVTLTNALNMTDVVDGVAGGLGAIAALALGLVSAALGHVVAAVALLALAGALLGFLPHNFRRRRIFLGDSGSLVVGFVLGAASLVGLMDGGVWLVLPAALALGLPLAECGITVLRRTLRAVTIERADEPRERFVLRRGPPGYFTPDARHIPHRLLRLGLSQPAALAVLYGAAALLGALAFAAVRWPRVGLWGGVAAAALVAWAATRWWYDELRVLDRGALLPLFHNRFVHHRLTHATWDAGVAAVAFVFTATFVPGAAPGPDALWLRAGIVAAGTVAGLWVGRVYAAAYLHAGLAEALRATRGGLVGVACAGLAWWLVVGEPWRVAGWMLFGYLTLTGVVGARLLFRLLEHAHERATAGTRRALIFGAGRAGRLALHAMRAYTAPGFVPLGYVDDDPELWGAEVRGYPVHGGSDRLAEILDRLQVDDLVMAGSPDPARRAAIAAVCAAHGIRLVAFQVAWDPVPDGEAVAAEPAMMRARSP